MRWPWPDKLAEALTAYQRALKVSERLAGGHPTVTKYQNNLAKNQNNIGLFYQTTGMPLQALKHLKRAIRILMRLRQLSSGSVAVQMNLRNAHIIRARAFNALGRHGEATTDWRQARKLASGRMRPYFQRQLCLSLARSGQHAQATAMARQLLKVTRHAIEAYDLACGYALSSHAAGRDAGWREPQTPGRTLCRKRHRASQSAGQVRFL